MMHPDVVPEDIVSMDVKLSDVHVSSVVHVDVGKQFSTKHEFLFVTICPKRFARRLPN